MTAIFSYCYVLNPGLRRLHTDYIDLYQFHDPDPFTPMSTSWEAMQQLIREGKVRYAGLSNHPIDLMQQTIEQLIADWPETIFWNARR